MIKLGGIIKSFFRKIVDVVGLCFHKPFDTSTLDGRNKERERRIALTAVTAVVSKIIATIIPLITVRVTLTYLGEEIYGLWSAVLSFFALFTFADLGLGSGLQTELSRCWGIKEDDYTRKMISSTYIMLFIVSLGLFAVFAVLYPFINWAKFINAETEQAKALCGGVVAAIVFSRIISIPVSLIQRLQLAKQEGYWYNIWYCVGSVLSLIAVFVISKLNLGQITMIWTSSMLTVVVSLLNTIVCFAVSYKDFRPKWKHFDKKVAKTLLLTGLAFFGLSILTSISLSVDDYIVAHVKGLSNVASYSIMHKITALLSVISAMLSTPLWTANGEALGRKEYDWVSKTTRKMAILSMVLALCASGGILLLIRPALFILSDGAIKVDYPILIGMCLTQIFVSFTNPYFMVLNSMKIVKFQIANYAVYAVITLPLKFLLGRWLGVVAITWVGAIGYFLVLTIPTYLKAKKSLTKCMLSEAKNDISST